MKKPINKVALFVWVMAAVVAVLNATELVYALETLNRIPDRSMETDVIVETTIRMLSSNIAVPATALIALGALIEIADGIRWRQAGNSR
jgi:hypothetical protein